MDRRLRDLLARHEAFWRREGTAPLQLVGVHRPLEVRGGIPLADGSRAADGLLVTPEMLDPARFHAGPGPGQVVQGDFLAGAAPPAMCWTEAAFGCPVRIVTGGPWAEAFVPAGGCTDELTADRRWIDKLDAFVDDLVARASGRYPVVQPLLRGPVDMMFAGLGHEEACLCLMAAPQTADRILGHCAELFIDIAARRLARTPPFAGGYLSSYGIWAPRPVVRTQVDNASLLSPATYRERVLPFDRRVFEAFDIALIHLHSCCLHIVDDLLQEEALDCIQVSIDYPGGPLAGQVLPDLRRILAAKPLIVTGPVYGAELRQLQALRPAGGLCLQVEVVPDDQRIQ